MNQSAVKEISAQYIVESQAAPESLITEHLDLWTSAITRKSTAGRGSSQKYELYGIKKLRELILELAVRGKLVPQDPNDEPASALLERIEEKKSELMVNGRLKGQKKAVLYEAGIKNHEIPPGWRAADFGDITFNRDSDRIPLSVSERRGRQGVYDYYGASGVIDRIDDFLFEKPLLLIGEDGANLINRSTPIAFMARGRYWVNNHAHVIDGISEDFLIYLSLYINSISLLPYITGMAQPKMNQAKMNSIQVLVPPEEEQKRIVAKVDELMALCDQLENQTEQSLEAHATLADTLLDTLTRAQSAKELAENWQRLEANWDTLFPTTLAGERAIDKLKQTILQLAVMGKLVPQDPNDEPASELVKRIEEEKKGLVRNGNIKKQKKAELYEPPIQANNIPSGWCAADFGDITFNRDAERIPLSVGERSRRQGKYDYYGASGVIDSIDDFLFDKPLLLIGEDGANLVNRSTPIAFLAKGKYWVNNHAHVIDGLTEDFLNYLSLYINSISLLPYITGMAQPKMNQAKMNSILVLVPPEEEQKRILDKVDELMILCDQLKERLQTAQQTQQHFTDAVVAGALS